MVSGQNSRQFQPTHLLLKTNFYFLKIMLFTHIAKSRLEMFNKSYCLFIADTVTSNVQGYFFNFSSYFL